MRYRLAIYSEASDKPIAERYFELRFDDIGRYETLSTPEEYAVCMRARELFRDAAYAAGKWPTRERNEAPSD